MLLRDLDIYVYKLDDEGTFDSIGVINEYTSLIWPDKFNGFATFELNAPVTEENSNLIKEDNIIWCGGNNACIIEIIESNTNDDGQKVFKAKGRTLEMFLTTRIIWGTYSCVNKYSSTAMYEIVNEQCVNPTDSYRKIPFLECAEDEQVGKVISFQRTGGEVYEAIEMIALDSDIGFDVLFRPKEKKLIFKVNEGIDRSNLNDASKIVIFSTDLEDILRSSYYKNKQELKTLAYVAGEGEGSNRKHIISGNSATKGFSRREMYIDARDIRSEIQRTIVDEDGREDTETVVITDDDYNDMLNDRGTAKLAEHIIVESFEATMRVIGDVQYKYGVDYSKGDTVIIQDTELGIQVVAKATEISENFDDEYELEITFGYSSPTLIQKIKRQFS